MRGPRGEAAAAAAPRRRRRRSSRRHLVALLLPPLLLASLSTPREAAAAANDGWGQVQYTGVVEAYYDGQVLVASAGSLVAPTAKLLRARTGGGRPAWPPFQSAEECRQACAALAGCNAFRFCARQDGCALADCGRWLADSGGPGQRLSLGGGRGASSSSSSFNATAAPLLQLPVKALGPFGGDAWNCVEPGKESAAAGWRAAAVGAYGGGGGGSGRKRRSLLDGGGGGGGGGSNTNNNNRGGPPRWPYGTCTLLRVDDPSKPPALKAADTGWGGGWRSGAVLLPEACLEKRTGQAVPPSADACRACLTAGSRDGKLGGGPSPDVCASCAASAAATGEERWGSSGGSGGADGGGRKAPIYAAMAGAALAAAKGNPSSVTLLGLQSSCVSYCAAAGSGGERDAAWKCPGCVLGRSPCAKCFSDRARRAALSAAFGGGSAPFLMQPTSSSSPARYDAGSCVGCVQEVAKSGGAKAERLLFGGCVACAAHASQGGSGNGRCARCVASAASSPPWWWPAARRSRDRTPCDVCDASVAPGDDAAFDACVGCFRDPGYQGGGDCLRCALLQDVGSVRRCYGCVARARMTDPRQRGCADCLDYYTPEKERERCLSCVENSSVVGSAKAVCSMCTADLIVNPGKPGASDDRRAAVGDRGSASEDARGATGRVVAHLQSSVRSRNDARSRASEAAANAAPVPHDSGPSPWYDSRRLRVLEDDEGESGVSRGAGGACRRGVDAGSSSPSSVAFGATMLSNAAGQETRDVRRTTTQHASASASHASSSPAI